MIALHDAVADYLTMRRALGFKLQRPERLLGQFADYLKATGTDTITTDAALAWATLPADTNPSWWGMRLSAVRAFARHLHALDPAHEVPPPGLLVNSSSRAVPYPFSDAELAALMGAARGLSSQLRAITIETIIGLLAVSGIRIGEALRLDRDNVDLVHGTLLVANTKFGKSRLVPLHASTVEALADYARDRDRLCTRVMQASFFVSQSGTRLLYSSFHVTWLDLVAQAGLRPRSDSCRPRPHDLRHRFAVLTLLGWYRDGVDVAAAMPVLSTYLGHAHPRHTYWYLSATAELLELAVARLDDADGATS